VRIPVTAVIRAYDRRHPVKIDFGRPLWESLGTRMFGKLTGFGSTTQYGGMRVSMRVCQRVRQRRGEKKERSGSRCTYKISLRYVSFVYGGEILAGHRNVILQRIRDAIKND